MKNEKRDKKPSIITKAHAWLGFISSFFILSLVVTGLCLNHPDSLKTISDSSNPFRLNPHYSYVTTAGMMYLATESRLFISKDKGLSFQPINTPFSAKLIVAITESEDSLFLAQKNGVLFKTKKNSLMWEMMEVPNTLDIFSLSYHDSQLWMTAYEGLFNYDGQSWKLVSKNVSPVSLYNLMKALHTGYPPFQWLHSINSIVAIIFIIILLSGIYLFIKFYIKALTNPSK